MAKIDFERQGVPGSVVTASLAADCINATRIADDAVGPEHIATDAVTADSIAAGAVDSAEIANASVDLAHMSADSVDSPQYVDGSIDVAHMSVNSVDSTQIVAGSIDAAHMSVNSINSDQYVDGSIDTAHIADDQITVDLMAVNSIDSDQYVDGSIDLAHLSVNSVDSDQYVDGSIDLIHLAASSVDQTKITLTGSLNVGTQKIINVVDPAAAQDAATKAYVDASATGEKSNLLDAVRVQTTANIASLTNGAPAQVDGVNLATSDRILVGNNQTTGTARGIYTVTTVGGGANGEWARATDATDADEVAAGSSVFVDQGTLHANTLYRQANTITTFVTDAQSWILFSRVEDLTAGNGITKAGIVLSVDSDTETGGAILGVNLTANGVGVNVASLVGTNMELTGTTIRTAASIAGDGLTGGSTAALSVDLTANKGLEIAAAKLGVKLNGTTLDVAAGGLSWGLVMKQELVTTEDITGADTAMTATLASAVHDVNSCMLFHNGVMQAQGNGKDYTLGGTGNRTITWLANSGTAADQEVTVDSLAAYYLAEA